MLCCFVAGSSYSPLVFRKWYVFIYKHSSVVCVDLGFFLMYFPRTLSRGAQLGRYLESKVRFESEKGYFPLIVEMVLKECVVSRH